MRGELLIFGGTAEGTELARLLPKRGYRVTVSVATDYGALMLADCAAQVRVGRLDELEMTALMQSRPFLAVIDATHPYADRATENIHAAAEKVGLSYRRLIRPEGQAEPGWLTAATAQEAAQRLNDLPGNVLLTTGSKDLAAFTAVEGYEQRLRVRILASEESLHKALSLGYPPNHIIAMHGPFSKELNLALLRQFQIQTLVTKRSGLAGGFREKAEAAREADAALLVIQRPSRETGLTLEELLEEYKGETP
ncbi:MAG: precorrin-6A reductase [Oscillospiraceae bacterium]|nr:precorrin-6A reductase [Oscillospiraceae bacterium]